MSCGGLLAVVNVVAPKTPMVSATVNKIVMRVFYKQKTGSDSTCVGILGGSCKTTHLYIDLCVTQTSSQSISN